MKQTINKKMKNVLLIVLLALVSQSCATMFGGSKYNARIHTPNDPSAEIFVSGESMGTGDILIFHKRNKDLDLEIKSDLCDDHDKIYPKEFRATIIANLLWGYGWIPATLIDLATGSYYRPDTDQRGVDRISTNDFVYKVNLENCKSDSLAKK